MPEKHATPPSMSLSSVASHLAMVEQSLFMAIEGLEPLENAALHRPPTPELESALALLGMTVDALRRQFHQLRSVRVSLAAEAAAELASRAAAQQVVPIGGRSTLTPSDPPEWLAKALEGIEDRPGMTAALEQAQQVARSRFGGEEINRTSGDAGPGVTP